VLDPNAITAPILPFWRSVVGRLQVAGGMMCLALMVANAQGLLSLATASRRPFDPWLSLMIAAASTVLCLAAIIINRGVPGRLNQLTKNMLALAERCDGSATAFADGGDEIARLSQALDVLRESSRRAAVSEANLKAAVENMIEGIVMISADGKVALHNQRLLTIFGLPAMNAIGRPRAEFNAMLVGALRWPQSAQDYLQRQLVGIRCDGNYRVFDVELPDNRVLRYSASMLADGNVMSYIEDISEQRAAAASILRLAHYDTLTELPNRTLFQERLVTAVEVAERDPAASATLLLCDLDRFKAVNDTYGHPVGDELLRQATRRMRAQVRAENILARLGGDEFAIIYLSRNDLDGAEGLAKRIVACLEQPFEIQGHGVSVGISIGIAVAPLHATSADDLMKRADLALYAAKEGGRNTHRVYAPAMSMLANEYGGLEAALRRAIENEGLHLHYQPQVDLRTRRIVGFEALARWDHPERGAVSPGIFIPLAEKAGLVVPLGAWVLRQACADALGWGDDIMIAVNVAPQQLRVEGFVDMVADVLAKSGLKAARLELEITETAPLYDDETILTVLRQLATMGVRVSMDDFGTGSTGLSYLHKFRFDTLKIDQSFVRKLGDGKEAELIVNAIVELSVSLNVQTVAEGIETEQQAAILRTMNCAIGQGYLFGRPGPASAADNLISKQNMASPKKSFGKVLSLSAPLATLTVAET
jgi:diguanylate cyclase (GGDEF)-like protein/PAS domain S-box-containing protein